MIYKFSNKTREVLANVFRNYCLAIFLLIVPSMVWVAADNSVWPWDTAWYGEVSIDLYYKLTYSISDWWQLMTHAFGTKAPGIAWLGQFFVPFAKITGSIDRALMIPILLAQFFSLLLMYKIVLSLTSKKTIAILGSLIMASAPLFIGMGHQYFVESLQLLAVTLLLFVLINIRNLNRYEVILSLLFILPFAMIVKITSPLYAIFPVGLIIIYLFRLPAKTTAKEYFREKKHLAYYALALGLVYVVSAWYLINWNTIYQFMHLASSGPAAELYGTRAPFFQKMNLWLSFFQKSLFIPTIMYFVFFILGTYLFQYIFFKKHKLLELPLFISISSVALILIFLSFQINEETRYLLPLLPYIAVLICWLLYKIDNVWMNIAAVILFTLQFIFVNSYSLGLIKMNPNGISSWTTVIHTNSDQKKDVELIIAQTCKSESANKYNIVGVEYPFLNANSIKYYATQQKIKTNFQCYYTSLGYAENSVDKAWARIIETMPPFFISGSDDLYSQKPDAFNAVALPILERVENSELFTKENNPDPGQIQIFRNISVDN